MLKTKYSLNGKVKTVKKDMVSTSKLTFPKQTTLLLMFLHGSIMYFNILSRPTCTIGPVQCSILWSLTGCEPFDIFTPD